MTAKFDMRAFVALLILALFAYAFYLRPDDEIFRGAIIAAFSSAYGYYLGSSNSSKETRLQVAEAQDQTRQALGIAEEAIKPTSTPQPVEVVNPPENPVPTTDSGETGGTAEELPEYAR